MPHERCVICSVFTHAFLHCRLHFLLDFGVAFLYCIDFKSPTKYRNQEEKQVTNMKKRIAAALTSATLTIGLTIPTMAAETSGESIRVSSYKGSALEMGERSGLIIGPSGADYTVISSAPDVVAVEQVLTFWVAIAKAEGSVEA